MKLASLLGWTTATIVLGMAAPAPATTITYTTTPGATQDSHPVNASATFTTGTNSLQIVVNNLQPGPTSVIQNLSDLDFVISTGQSVVGSGGGITSSSGTERNVAQAASGDDHPFSDGAVVATGWGLREGFTVPFGLGTGFKLCIICPLSGGTEVSPPSGQPEHTIIGPEAATGFYTGANSSIAGNDPHNPFLFGPVTFNLTIAGLTSDSTVSGVVFSFGTTVGNETQGCVQCTSVPVPPSLLMVGLGTALAAVFVRSRRRAARREPTRPLA